MEEQENQEQDDQEAQDEQNEQAEQDADEIQDGVAVEEQEQLPYSAGAQQNEI